MRTFDEIYPRKTSPRDVSHLKNVGDDYGASDRNEIKKGEFIQSPNKQYTLVMQTDCNFVLYVCNLYIYLLVCTLFLYILQIKKKGH